MVTSLGLFHWCKRQISRLREGEKSAPRWETVAFYRQATSVNAKASGLRFVTTVALGMSTLIAKHNNGDPVDVELDFVQVTSVLPNR
jgi:hypothetical protein